MTRVAVLGAGPTGLYAALLAARRGFSVSVFERGSAAGGMSASFEVAGQRVDLGSHRLHPSIDPIELDCLRELLGGDLQTRERNGRIHLEGRWVAFPLRMTDMVRALPPSFTVRAVGDTLLGPTRRLDETSFASRVATTLGPTVGDRFYAPYARKLYGSDPDRLDAELARRRIAATSAVAILRRIVRARATSGRRFMYPRLGYGQITDALADAARAAGVDIRLNTKVESLNTSGDRVELTTTNAEAFDHVFSTIPVRALAEIVTPSTHDDVGRAIDTTKTRGMTLVYLVVGRPQYTEYDAHYIPAENLATARLSESKNYRLSADDPPDRTVLCAELPCWPGDSVWTSSDDDLGERVRAELLELGLPDPDPIAIHVVRLPSVYPVYVRGAAAERDTIEVWAHSIRGVTVVGRQGLQVPDNLHHVLRMARRAVACIDEEGRRDETAWRRALEDFRTHVVED